MEEVTLNKDGKPRKKGSGKTKGAGCYAKIPWRDLKKRTMQNILSLKIPSPPPPIVTHRISTCKAEPSNYASIRLP